MTAPVIGLTGILGSGKSAAASMFAKLGAHVIDMDEAGRWVVENNADVQRKIKRQFGVHLFDEQNRLQRRNLGEIVFADAEALRALNAIVHPAMLRRVRELVAEAGKKDAAPYILVDAALIFELEFDRYCDFIVAVVSPLEMCLERAEKYKKLTRRQALERIRAQMPQEEKAARADMVIGNDSTLKELEKKVRKVHLWLMNRQQP